MKVAVTNHAFERLKQRGIILERHEVTHEVSAAVLAGRMAKTEPRWLTTDAPGRMRAKAQRNGGGKYRYVWPSHQRYAYIVKAEEGGWLVLTVMRPYR